MKNLTWQNPEQLFVAQELINKVKSKCCGIKVHEFIKEYFNSRKKDNLDIDSRYLIIRECAKFKCRKTILFLQKINACEKNEELQLMAYNYLCRFGLHPRLRKKRKGKKRRTSTAKHQLEENPSTLLKLIFENQQILHKHFDVFLSHSYGRQLELLQAKDTLNSQGLVVYVDWINDAEMLEREKQNDDTFKVLYERLKQSSSLLFIQTKLSVASKYCMDEIEYFRQLRRPIYLLEVDTINDNSALFEGMIKVKLNQGKYMTEDGKDISDHLLEHNQRYGFS